MTPDTQTPERRLDYPQITLALGRLEGQGTSTLQALERLHVVDTEQFRMLSDIKGRLQAVENIPADVRRLEGAMKELSDTVASVSARVAKLEMRWTTVASLLGGGALLGGGGTAAAMKLLGIGA